VSNAKEIVDELENRKKTLVLQVSMPPTFKNLEKFTPVINMYCPGASFTLLCAYDNLPASSQSYGFRIYNYISSVVICRLERYFNVEENISVSKHALGYSSKFTLALYVMIVGLGPGTKYYTSVKIIEQNSRPEITSQPDTKLHTQVEKFSLFKTSTYVIPRHKTSLLVRNRKIRINFGFIS
jgi:hypothetical protein